jgi:hypothetical protein
MKPIEHEYVSHVAYTRALEEYCTKLEESQCKWPLCQTEEYQQAIGEQVKQELYTGRPWVSLTEEEVVAAESSVKDAGLKLAYRVGMHRAEIILMKKNT